MRFTARTITTILFIFLFIFSILASTIVFKILDRNFIKSTIANNGVYEKMPEFLASSIQKDPRIPRSEQANVLTIAQKATPELVKSTLENTLDSFFDYLEGKSKTISFYFPAKELGLPGNTQETYTSPLEIPKTNNPAIEYFKKANGSKNSLVLTNLGFLLLTLIVFGIHLALGGNKKTRGSGILLAVCGIVVLIISVAGKLFLDKLVKDFSQSIEPSQVLISLLAPPILGSILNLWLIIACTSTVLGIILIFTFPKKEKGVQ